MKFKKIAAFLTAACMLVPIGMSYTNYSSVTVSAAQIDWDPYFDHDASWYSSSEATAFADEIIKYQLSDGGWRKEMTNTSVTGSWAKSTIDNEATTSQIIYLAKVYNQTKTEKYKTACLKGIDLLINGQYSNGGWPQVFNDAGTYHAHITYNDTAMVRVLEIMQDVAAKTGDFTFVDNSYAARANTAVEKGVKCILDTQITVNGVKTAWCQQHDETTLKPASARAYELPSISSSESVGIVNFLKSLDNKSNEIIRSINAAVKWMDSATLHGIEIQSYTNSDGESDKKVVQNASASPIWARFYYLTDGVTPMFVSRESVAADNWDHIGAERRTGYSWYGTWPKKLIAAGYLEENPDEPVTPPVSATYPNNLYVGYSSQQNNYGTIQEAVNAAAKINPSSEDQRVAIHIAPGTYREQVIVNTPYISFVNDNPSEQVLITWYYGIGYKYYSVGSDGYYNADNAKSKSAKLEPTTRWGSTVGLKNKANYFRAEYITFENSFNRYVTAEEIADGVEPSGSQSITFDRTASGADVTSKTATERGAAIAIDGNYSEFYKCDFLGSQDTLYAGSANGYFKECFVQGNTDYIFGNGSHVFENCELRFGGYSSSAAGGYITAHKGTGGYLFYNCDVTANSALTVKAGYFGRPWGAEANVAFVNTDLQYEDIITPAGWYKMSNNAPENAKFKEYNTRVNGTAVNTSGRTAGTVLSSETGLTPTDYFGGWVPYYYNRADVPVNPGKTGAVIDTAYKYTIKNVGSGLNLEVKDSVAADGTDVQQGTKGAGGWIFEDAGNGYYRLYSEVGDGKTYLLDLSMGAVENGTNIGIWSDTACDAQLFKFVKNSDGSYTICTKVTNDQSCLGVGSGSKEEGATVIQWACDGSDNQKWTLSVKVDPVSGNLVKNLVVNDADNYMDWKIDTSVAVGDLVFGDRDFTYATFPEELIGSEAILTACDSKAATGDVATFVTGEDCIAYVALDTRVTAVPSWLSGWNKTNLTATSNNDVTFAFYLKEFAKGETVTLGGNGQTASCVNYTAFVSPAPPAPYVIGDVNLDGSFDVADIVAMNYYITSNDAPLSMGTNQWDMNDGDAADINSDGKINVFDTIIMRRMLLEDK